MLNWIKQVTGTKLKPHPAGKGSLGGRIHMLIEGYERGLRAQERRPDGADFLELVRQLRNELDRRETRPRFTR